jgi:3-methyladenine DNA glycosylase Tag
MGILRALFAGVAAKLDAIRDVKSLVAEIDTQEKMVEDLRFKRDQAKFDAGIQEATLYLKLKDATEKISDTYVDAEVDIDETTQKLRVAVIDAEHDYKVALIGLTRLYNTLSAKKLEV